MLYSIFLIQILALTENELNNNYTNSFSIFKTFTNTI